jgi:hypothetical protein
MATIDFNEILQDLKSAVELLAKQQVSDYWKEAVGDADQFFERTKEQLERWATRLAKGELTADDFEWLVKGKKDLAEMKLLKQAGVTLIRVDEFKAALLDVIVKTVVGKVL